MSARRKLNGAYFNGALFVSGILGLMCGSGAVFAVSLCGLVVTNVIAGNIRPPDHDVDFHLFQKIRNGEESLAVPDA